MISVSCDRCHRSMEPKEDIGYISWCFKKGVDGDLGQNILEGKHFCERCMDRIMYIICNFDDEEQEEKKKAKTEKKARQQINQNLIDAILELKAQGWKIKEIAKEVQIEEKKVSNILYRYKKRE